MPYVFPAHAGIHKLKAMFYNLNQFYIYILASQKNGTLYIGVTNNLERRVFEHKKKMNARFTSKYNVDKLVYFEAFGFIKDAIVREKQLKKWNRQWKINLIEEDNKDWKDLAEDWYD